VPFAKKESLIFKHGICGMIRQMDFSSMFWLDFRSEAKSYLSSNAPLYRAFDSKFVADCDRGTDRLFVRDTDR
jgi:hypothetical protein